MRLKLKLLFGLKAGAPMPELGETNVFGIPSEVGRPLYNIKNREEKQVFKINFLPYGKRKGQSFLGFGLSYFQA
jgi:hypothetical protein